MLYALDVKTSYSMLSSLIKIEIPEGVTEIKSYAFLECTSLETVEIPDSVETISSRVFQYCQKLKNIKKKMKKGWNI